MALRVNNNNSIGNYQSQRQRYNNFGDRYNTNNFDNRNNQQIRPTKGRGGDGFIRTNRGYGHTPNKDLQVNSSRFGRLTSTNNTNNKYLRNNTRGNGTPTGRQYYGRYASQQTSGDDDESIENEYEFPNDWVEKYKSTQPLHHRDHYYGWRATKPLARYHTRSNGKLYPDRRGVPQIAKKGKIEEIIRDGCQFVVDHYRINSSLLPSSITLMSFKPNSGHHDQSGSQIKLHYSWISFFRILWINAKGKTGFGIEIPPTGWKLALIEKFQDSIQRNVAAPLAMALCKGYIDESSEEFANIMVRFNELSDRFDHDLSTKRKEFAVQDMSIKEKQRNVSYNHNGQEPRQTDDEQDDDGLKRNAREAMKYFKDNNFSLCDDEPRFIKKIDGNVKSESYLTAELPQEILNCVEMAKQLSSITDYEWRIGAVLDDGDPYLAMEPWSEGGNNPFEMYVDLKQKYANDQEGDITTEDVKILFVKSYFDKMEQVFRDYKESSADLFEDDNDWNKHKNLLKELHRKISRVYYIDQVDGPGERGSIFDGDWMRCCVEYNYPGKEVLDEIDFDDDAIFGATDDYKTNEFVQPTVSDKCTDGYNVRQYNNGQEMTNLLVITETNQPEKELSPVTNEDADIMDDFIAQTADNEIIASDTSQNNVAATFEAHEGIVDESELPPLDDDILFELQGIVNKSFVQSPKINDKTHIEKCIVSCPAGNDNTGSAAGSFGNANNNLSNYQNNQNTNNLASNWNNNGCNNGNSGNGGNGNGKNPAAANIYSPVLKCPIQWCNFLFQYGDPAFADHMQKTHNWTISSVSYPSQPQSPPTSHQSQPIHPNNMHSSPIIGSSFTSQSSAHTASPSTPLKSQSNTRVCSKKQLEPGTKIRAHQNIYIPHKFTVQLKNRASVQFKTQCYRYHKRSECKCDSAYLWIDNDVAMQFENDANQINTNTKIFNSGIPDKSIKSSLFYVVEKYEDDGRSDEKKSDTNSNNVVNKYPWQMRDKLYDGKEICEMFDLKESELPPPVRKSENFVNQMEQYKLIRQSFNDRKKVNKFIEKTKWCKVQVFSKLDKQRRRTLSITKEELIHDLKSVNDFGNMTFIPILIFENDKYEVHQLMVVKIDGIDAGISVVWDHKKKFVRVKGIYFDKSMILKQHQWISLEHLKDCHCLDSFDTQRMNHLAIGNPDDAENQIKRLRKQLESRSPTSSMVSSMSVSVSTSGSSKGN